MISPVITISQDLLSLLGERLYNSRHSTIVIRELAQNAIDASARNVSIHVTRDDGYVVVECVDNGIGMSQETLLNVFLGIGKTGKAIGESVGGFGIAKVSIFSGLSWSVSTKQRGESIRRSVSCNGQNLEYTESPAPVKDSGTAVTVKTRDSYLDNYGVYKILTIDRRVKLTFSLFGSLVDLANPHLRLVQESSYRGSPYTVKYCKDSHYLDGYILYRIKGLPQFSEYISGLNGGCIVVDFDTINYRPRDSDYPFSLSRESISSEVREVVSAVAKRFIIDSISSQSEDKKWIYRKIGNYVHEVERGESIPDNPYLLKLWKAILTVTTDESFMTGYTTDIECGAKRGKYSDIPLYLINLTHIDFSLTAGGLVLDLWHLACHEVTHSVVGMHNEQFSSTEGHIANRSADKFYQAIPNLRKIAIKAQYFYLNPE